jgi:hypothetical protein
MNQPTITETIAILMEYAATKGCKAVVTFEPLPGEESRIDLHSKNNTNDKV